MTVDATMVTLQEYLTASYRPDVEYINGQLKGKPMPTLLHGFVQALIASWFLAYTDQWDIIAATEARTQVDDNHVRLPDVVIVDLQENMQGALTNPPLIAVEILSPRDTYADLRERAADLHDMGVQNIWLIDPQRRTAEVWNGRNWQLFEGGRLAVADRPIYLDLPWLWARVDKKKLQQPPPHLIPRSESEDGSGNDS